MFEQLLNIIVVLILIFLSYIVIYNHTCPPEEKFKEIQSEY